MTLKESLEKKRYQWIVFKNKTKSKTYKREVISIERDEAIIGHSNFHSWLIQTHKGKVRLTINKATNPPKIGSIIEFRISPYKHSFTEFFICEIVNEYPGIAVHLQELYEQERIKKLLL